MHFHAQIEAGGVLGEDGTLTVDGGAVEIAVVYFRAGYAPGDYFGRAEWDARLKLERSTAIKSPSIGYHLAGTKKVQQVLAQEGQVREAFALSIGGVGDDAFRWHCVGCSGRKQLVFLAREVRRRRLDWRFGRGTPYRQGSTTTRRLSCHACRVPSLWRSRPSPAEARKRDTVSTCPLLS